MRFVTERKEIAQVLNFGKYPVIMFDLSKPKDGWESVYEGSRVRIDEEREYGNAPMFRDCRAMIYVDNYGKGVPNTVENRLMAGVELAYYGCFISDGFGPYDVIEMAEKAQAPVVKAGQSVAIVYYWTDAKNARYAAVRIMKVPDHVGRYSSVTLEDVE